MRVVCYFRYSETDYPLAFEGNTRWIYLMVARADTNSDVYTSLFADIIHLGRKVAVGEVCPIGITIQFRDTVDGSHQASYVYAPNGDLVKIEGSGVEIIPISK